jgi:branched-chain amino acid transport system permease protein
MLQGIVQFLINALSLGGQYALMALGLSLVYSILDLTNFAYGELIMIGGYTLYIVGTLLFPEIAWLIIALAAILMATVSSLLLERVAFRPVRHATGETMLITSFAVSTFLQTCVILFISPRTRPVRTPAFFTQMVEVQGMLISLSDLLCLLISLALLALLTIFMRRSILGSALRSAAEDFTMTRLLGIRANTVIALAFAISGALAGVVSLFWVGKYGSVVPAIGLTPVIMAFIATVLGGLGSLTGAVAGGYLLGFIIMSLNVLLPLDLMRFRQVLVFAVVILILVFRPHGLIARTKEERI